MPSKWYPSGKWPIEIDFINLTIFTITLERNYERLGLSNGFRVDFEGLLSSQAFMFRCLVKQQHSNDITATLPPVTGHNNGKKIRMLKLQQQKNAKKIENDKTLKTQNYFTKKLL